MGVKERVKEELDQLTVKVTLLQAFVDGENTNFKSLHGGAQRRLMKQLQIMWDYRDVLVARLNEDF